jgi:ribosome-binding factor A
LRHAKIFVSVYGPPELQADILDILKEWTPQVRTHIGKRIRLHHTPEILFCLDTSLERGSRVTQLLDQISRGEL